MAAQFREAGLDAVVWVEGPKGKVASAETVVVMRGKAFVPRVAVVGVGGTVAFQNQDPIFHNEAFLKEALSPLADNLARDGEAAGNLVIGTTLSSQEDYLGPQDGIIR